MTSKELIESCRVDQNFASWDKADDWLHTAIKEERTAFRCAKIYLVEEIETLCKECKCDGLRLAHVWTVDRDGHTKFFLTFDNASHCAVVKKD